MTPTDHNTPEVMDFDRKAILAAFLVESEEGLQEMEQALLSLETDPSIHEHLDDIFRVAHTTKGNAAALELSELAGFAHVVEDLLDVLRADETQTTPELISLLLKATDALRSLVPAACSGQGELSPEQQQLRRQIAKEVQARADRVLAVAPPAEASSPGTTAQGAAGSGSARRTLRADITKLDNMLDLTGEIAIAQGRMRRLVESLDAQQGAQLLEIQREVERLFMDLQEQVMNVRMVPVGPLFRQFARAVRDISHSHNKRARLEVHGGDVEIDTTVLEHLKDPIMHMIRNAVDHGLETPEARLASGKDPCGMITISASHSAGSIVIQVKDDGAGFNRAKIAQKAKKLGLIGDGEWLPESQLYRLVFHAGFSTAESVTDLSGRGVGMDVVRRNIDALRGSIDVESKEGQGTTIAIRLPLTLAIIEGFGVRCGTDTFVIPLDYVTECVELSQASASEAGSTIFNLRDSALPYLRLRDVFHCPGERPKRENVVVVKTGELQAGIAVDELLGASQTVIKPLGRLFQDIIGVAGSTILGDGRVGLILDVPSLLREVAQSNSLLAAR